MTSQKGLITMVAEAVVFTVLFLLALLAAAAVLPWWLVTRTCGQHADAGEGALSVAQLEAQLAAETQALVETTARVRPVRLFPMPPVEPVAPVLIEPELLAA